MMVRTQCVAPDSPAIYYPHFAYPSAGKAAPSQGSLNLDHFFSGILPLDRFMKA